MGCDVVDTHRAVIITDEEPWHTPNGIIPGRQVIWGGCQRKISEEQGIIDRSIQANSGGPGPIRFSGVVFRWVREGDSRNGGQEKLCMYAASGYKARSEWGKGVSDFVQGSSPT